MGKRLFILYFIFHNYTLNCQVQDSTSLNYRRVLTVSTFNTLAFSSSIAYLNSVWYKEFEKTIFHTFNDSKNWLQTDKVGHAFAAYHFNEVVSKSFRWAGLSQNKSALIGSSVSLAYLTSLEIMDGYSSEWGFSWSDMLANGLGSSLYLAQEKLFKEQKIQFKFSYNESGLASIRPQVLGKTIPEKLLKDYNAQTYWLSYSPFNLMNTSKNMKWLCIAFGYGINNKLVGNKNLYLSTNGDIYRAERQFFVSLDIDVKALNIRKKWLKTLLSPVNVIKVPMPTIYWSGKTFYGKLLF